MVFSGVSPYTGDTFGTAAEPTLDICLRKTRCPTSHTAPCKLYRFWGVVFNQDWPNMGLLHKQMGRRAINGQ